MTTPLVYSLRKIHESDFGSDLVDHTLYKQLIGLLMYLIHSKLDICDVVSILS